MRFLEYRYFLYIKYVMGTWRGASYEYRDHFS